MNKYLTCDIMDDSCKLAYYGYLEFFDVDYEIDDELMWCIINGCYSNNMFAFKCMEKIPDFTLEQDLSLSLNIPLPSGYWYDSREPLYYNFCYPSKEICLSLIKLLDRHSYLGVVCVIKNWKDLYNLLTFEEFDSRVYNVSRYLKREYYMQHQISLLGLNEDINSFEFSFASLAGLLNYRRTIDDYEEEEMSFISHFEKVNLNTSKFEPIYSNSYTLNSDYCKDLKTNYSLSKIISINPNDISLFEKYKPFILHTGLYTDYRLPNISKYIEIEPLSVYNFAYIFLIELVTPVFLDILPEYTLYIVSVKTENKKITELILEKYKEHGCLYKILDIENECYLNYEKIYELPKVDPINLENGEFLRC